MKTAFIARNVNFHNSYKLSQKEAGQIKGRDILVSVRFTKNMLAEETAGILVTSVVAEVAESRYLNNNTKGFLRIHYGK